MQKNEEPKLASAPRMKVNRFVVNLKKFLFFYTNSFKFLFHFSESNKRNRNQINNKTSFIHDFSIMFLNFPKFQKQQQFSLISTL